MYDFQQTLIGNYEIDKSVTFHPQHTSIPMNETEESKTKYTCGMKALDKSGLLFCSSADKCWMHQLRRKVLPYAT